MKKVLVIILIIVVVLIGSLLVIPVFFKQNLLDAAKNTLNKQLNAEVQLADANISLIKNFPKATVEFQKIQILGKDEFQGDTLLDVAYIKTKMDLASLFRKSGMNIEEIIMNEPRLNLVIGESGMANWDVAPTSSEQKPAAVENTGDDSEFKLALDKVEIRNAKLVYNDKAENMLATLSGIDLDISGEMFGSSTRLQTKGLVSDIAFQYQDVNYLSKTSLEMSTLLDVDFEKMKFTIADNELLLNRLPLQLEGSVEMPSDTTFMDLQVKTKASDFNNFLALVPPDYEEYLKDIQTDGSATISGEISGFYYGENYPVLNLEMMVSDGKLKYADMPEQISDIAAEVRISKPQGDLDLMKIDVKKAHAAIRNTPVDLNLTVTTPVSDPYFDGSFVGKINLSQLKDALPIDSVNISGIIDANLFVKGNYSDVENEAYDKIQSDGIVKLDNFSYDSPDLTQKIIVSDGQLDFSPKSINLSKFNMKVGQSDFSLSGKVYNYLNYVLKDGILKGDLLLSSQFTNFNELLRLQRVQNEAPAAAGKSEAEGQEQEEVLAFNVPEKIDITFRSKINNAVFDRLPISSVNGEIRAYNEKLILEDLSMNTLDGKLTMNGSYQNTPQNQPLFDFGFDIAGFDLPMMYNTLSGARKLLPEAKNSQGKISSGMQMKGRLSPQLKLIPVSTNGNGTFQTRNIEIKDSPLFNQLGGILKKEKLKNVTIDDFTTQFTVEDGNLTLKPFTTKVIGQETRIEGKLNSESLLDMRLDFNVERDMFGPDIQKILAIIPGNEKIKILPAGVELKGPVGDTKVNLDLSATQKAVTDATKDDLKKSLEQLGKGLKKIFN